MVLFRLIHGAMPAMASHQEGLASSLEGISQTLTVWINGSILNTEIRICEHWWHCFKIASQCDLRARTENHFALQLHIFFQTKNWNGFLLIGYWPYQLGLACVSQNLKCTSHFQYFMRPGSSKNSSGLEGMNTETTQNVEKNEAKGSTKPLESRGSEENLNQGEVIGMVGGLPTFKLNAE